MAIILAGLLLWPSSALGQGEDLRNAERIESFFSRIAILPQGGIEVTETIILVNHGDKIRWGFERLLPRWHQAGNGLEQASGYEILEVLNNGEQTEYSLVDTEAGLAITVGDPALTLAAGRYVYTLTYRCTRLVQLHPFAESLEWNATGSWPVPVERASVSLEFARAPRPGFDSWSAVLGDSSQPEGWTSNLEEEDWLRFEATRPLEPGESMRVQASWPKGYCFIPAPGERILDLDASIMLDRSGTLSVREELTFIPQEGDIAFQRDFAGLFQDGEGKRRVPQIEIHAVTLNGQNVPWTLDRTSRGKSLTVGGADNPLPPGLNTLAIVYNIDRQVVMGKDLEELPWQLPGFPLPQAVDQARLTVELPQGIPLAKVMMAAYTRLEGETSGDVFHYLDGVGRIVIASTRTLDPGEVVESTVAWPAGGLPQPTWRELSSWYIRDNASAVATLTILVLLLLWYIPVWFKLGRRTLAKAEPTPAPPDKVSPALLRYLRSGSYDNRTFSSAVVSLAVKGCLMIVEEEGRYALVSSGISPYLPADEEVLMKALFAKRMAVSPAKHPGLVKAARKAHRKELQRQVRGKLLRYNRGWYYPAAVISLLGAAGSAWLQPAPLWSALAMMGFVLWGCLLAWVAVRTWTIIPGLVDDRGRGVVSLAIAVELGAAFGTSFLWGSWLAQSFGWLTIAAFLGIVLVNAVFSWLLTAPTSLGAEALHQAQGFKAWLTDSEEGRPGGPSRFEKHLPYAVALDASSQWGRRFGVPKRKGSFSPRWYQGSRWHTINAETLAASLSMLPLARKDRL